MDIHPDLHFRAVEATEYEQRFVDGRQQLTLRGTDSERPQILRLEFTTGRIGPHDLEVTKAAKLRRVRPGVDVHDELAQKWVPAAGVISWDALLPAGQTEITVSWLEPSEGASISRLGLAAVKHAAADAPDEPADIWYPAGANTSLIAYRAAKREIEADPTRTPIQRKAACFWLGLDLASSLADPVQDGPAVAKELGVDAAYVNVDAVQRKWLTAVLHQRWRTRANCCATGVPFELVFFEIPGDARALAGDVAELVQGLLERQFPELDDEAATALVEFACGRLRRPDVGDRLNVEPNSMAMASFAEVMDLASVTDGNTATEKLAARDSIRRLFIAMIAPFVDTYGVPPAQQDRFKERFYRYQNLGFTPANEVPTEWTTERLHEHVAQVRSWPSAKVKTHWGQALVRGLADEHTIRDAVKWRCSNPATPILPANTQRNEGAGGEA